MERVYCIFGIGNMEDISFFNSRIRLVVWPEVSASLQLVSNVLWFEFLDPLDEVALLQAAVAPLVPPAQDLTQVLHLNTIKGLIHRT